MVSWAQSHTYFMCCFGTFLLAMYASYVLIVFFQLALIVTVHVYKNL